MRTATTILGAAVIALTLTGCGTPQGKTDTLPETFSGTGTFVAGEDIRPGYYEQATPEPGCQYAIQNEQGDTKAMNSGDALLIASKGDTVTIEGCGEYVWFQE